MHLLRMVYSIELKEEVSLRINGQGTIHIKVLGNIKEYLVVSELFEFFPSEGGKLTADFDLAISKLIVSGFGGELCSYSRVDKAPYLEFILELPKME